MNSNATALSVLTQTYELVAATIRAGAQDQRSLTKEGPNPAPVRHLVPSLIPHGVPPNFCIHPHRIPCQSVALADVICLSGSAEASATHSSHSASIFVRAPLAVTVSSTRCRRVSPTAST